MSWLRDLLSNWKVTVALVGGAVVVATVYGTCTFSPAVGDDAQEDVSDAPEAGAEEVSNTTVTPETTGETEAYKGYEATTTTTTTTTDE